MCPSDGDRSVNQRPRFWPDQCINLRGLGQAKAKLRDENSRKAYNNLKRELCPESCSLVSLRSTGRSVGSAIKLHAESFFLLENSVLRSESPSPVYLTLNLPPHRHCSKPSINPCGLPKATTKLTAIMMRLLLLSSLSSSALTLVLPAE